MAARKHKDTGAATADTPTPIKPDAADVASAASTHAPPEQTTDDAGAAEKAAAPELEFVTLGWPLPAEVWAAIQKRPELRALVRLVVKAKSERGRHRAGRYFTREETFIPFGDLNDAAITAIGGDAELIVAVRVPAKPL